MRLLFLETRVYSSATNRLRSLKIYKDWFVLIEITRWRKYLPFRDIVNLDFATRATQPTHKTEFEHQIDWFDLLCQSTEWKKYTHLFGVVYPTIEWINSADVLASGAHIFWPDQNETFYRWSDLWSHNLGLIRYKIHGLHLEPGQQIWLFYSRFRERILRMQPQLFHIGCLGAIDKYSFAALGLVNFCSYRLGTRQASGSAPSTPSFGI